MNNFCGLDFGTSNSSIGYIQNNSVQLARFGNKSLIPSSIFFEFDEDAPFFGNEAIAKYIDGKEGRMIWSPKNALGTNLVHEKTQIKDKNLSFQEIISLIIRNMKDTLEAQSQQAFTNIVVGRPVFYNDKDPKLDKEAQDAMLAILTNLGFKNIEFEYEPIAAATHYEQSVDKEQIALIVDMGGGTSDFTVAKLNRHETNHKNKILSIGGIHIAGTNFDKRFSLKSLMPELGLNCSYKTLEGKWVSIPPTLHKDLATWHKIGFCYNKKNIAYVRNKIYTSDCPHKFERLLQVLEHRLGHHLAIAVEQGKIALSSNDISQLLIPDVTPPIDVAIKIQDFEDAIRDDVDKIISVINSTIAQAQVSHSDIDAIFMTGGASLVPLVKNNIKALLPKSQLVDGDKFGSVTTGLTLIAHMKFGS